MAKPFMSGGGAGGGGGLFAGIDPTARYQMVNAMLAGAMQPGANASPWVQALAPIAGGFIGARNEAKIGKARDEATQQAIDALAGFGGAFGGFGGGGATPAAFGPSGEDWGYEVPQEFVQSLIGMESGGNYSAVGPETGKGRALGFGQVMPFNVGPWSREILGREVSPEEFLANPALQEQIVYGKLDDYWRQTGGSAEDVASLWHSGVPLDEAIAQGRRDVNMSTQDYVAKVAGGGGGGGGGAPSYAGQRYSRDQVDELLGIVGNDLVNESVRGIAESMLENVLGSGMVSPYDASRIGVNDARQDYWRSRAESERTPEAVTRRAPSASDVINAQEQIAGELRRRELDGMTAEEAWTAMSQEPQWAPLIGILEAWQQTGQPLPEAPGGQTPPTAGGNAAPSGPTALPPGFEPGLPGGARIQ